MKRPVAPSRLILLSLCSAPLLLAAGTEPRVAFNRDVRPILSNACFQCHGPDEKERKGGLRLDLKAPLYEKAKSGEIAVVPGKPDQSELVARILLSDDDEDVMPPRKSGKILTAAQKDILRRWVEEGGDFEGHWAFVSPGRPPVPVIEGAPHPVDAFLLERLAKEGLTMQPETDRATLLRRVTLDLTGLPPTLAELDAFAADTAPDAYEKVVDRLLATPAYAERMAMSWLDYARYADSHGFQTDSSRQQWPWRDWLIGAFQRNEPFDQFTIEQLAGDLLPNATPEQITATGFHRNHRLNGEGGRIVEEWHVESVIDRVETTGLTWMALTLNCCRCHDHKYDPITQKEFYQLYAFFNSGEDNGVLGGVNTDPVLRLPTKEQEREKARLEAAVAEATKALADAKATVGARFAEWEKTAAKTLADRAVDWRSLNQVSAKSEGGSTLTAQSDGSWLAGGTNPAHDTYVVTGQTGEGNLSAIMVEALPDPSLPGQSLGRYANGNFVLSAVEAELTTPGKAPVPVTFVRAESSYDQNGYPAASILDKTKGRGWAIDGNDPAKRIARRAVFVAAAAEPVAAGSQLKVTLRHQAIGGHNIGRFRLSISGQAPALVSLKGEAIPEEVRSAVLLASGQRTDGQKKALETFFREKVDGTITSAEASLEKARKKVKDLEASVTSVMVMKEMAQPKPAFILQRGEYDKPGAEVGRGLPAVLPPLPRGAPMNRLGLAQWLVSKEHPLTARVWVNRIWEKFFGVGIVKTVENLGSQSDWPVHPELLDWLASEFMAPTQSPKVNGRPAGAWDMKAIQKLLVTSRAYRQSSRVTPDLMEKDPENRLLARGPRFRLTGEAVRDQALALSGLLVPQIGGPSVRPYMPAGVWDETSRYGDLRNYKSDEGDGLYRRTMYTIWKRTAAPPTMMLFDAPTREVCTVKRSRTNTPLQALALLNEVTFVEAARALAQSMIMEGGSTPEDRLRNGYRRVTARAPSPDTLALLRQGWERRLDHFKKDPAAAEHLIHQGHSRPAGGLDPAELAAYTVTANVLLNLDEVVTRE